jgi:outer membrane protein TolC
VRGVLIAAAVIVASSQVAAQQPAVATPLRALVQEAEQHNPAIAASRHAWQASTHVPVQARALSGPEVTVQQFAVGRPIPFAGFRDNDFAYIGVGVSQDLPYPGKRDLRAAVAAHDAQSLRARSDGVTRQIVEALKLGYVQLAYLQHTLPILERHGDVLDQIEQIAEARYRVGQGNQADVLGAQLQRTKILETIAEQRQQAGMLQAELKRLLNRTQDTPDIVTEPLVPTPITLSAAEVQAHARRDNPDLRVQSALVERERTSVALARKERLPDFGVQFMYEHTASAFPDYYMGAFSVRLPSRSRQRAALAEAEESHERAAHQMQAETQRVLSEARQQYVALEGSRDRLAIYRDGLVPQADAVFQAAMAAYASGRQDFETLLSAAVDVLNTNLAYWRALADHESAVARLEAITGSVRP